MSMPTIIADVSSGVVSVTFYNGDNKIASGSAFLSGGKIVSNNHVFHPVEGDFAPNTIVRLMVSDSRFIFQYSELTKYVISGSTVDNHDYILLDISTSNFFDGKFQFELGTHDDMSVGEQILIMGYPFEHENLTSHLGHVSAKYIEGDVNVIQLDASVNNGNSGGPLIDPSTKKVIGIVTRKATGLASQFDELIHSFDSNATVLSKLQGLSWGKLTIGEIFATSQRQMKEIARNIKRSANVGIGYAFSCNKLKEENSL